MEATYSHEMEQMRSEMCELKSLLKEQEIVNEKLMRRAMNTSYSKERRNIRFSIIMAALAILLFCALHPHFGFPLWFFIITQLFFLFAMAPHGSRLNATPPKTCSTATCSPWQRK